MMGRGYTRLAKSEEMLTKPWVLKLEVFGRLVIYNKLQPCMENYAFCSQWIKKKDKLNNFYKYHGIQIETDSDR